MKKRTSTVASLRRRKSCIDEMDTLLNQVVDFKKLIESTDNVSDPAFKQEYRLFKQHLEWAIEDLGADSYITYTDINATDINTPDINTTKINTKAS